MERMRIDDLRDLFPETDELRPLVDRLVAGSERDPDHRWSSAGELETVGRRLLDLDGLDAVMEEALAEACRRHEALFRCASDALRAAAEGRPAAVVDALLEASGVEERGWRLGRAESWALAAARTADRLRDRRPAARALRRAARTARSRGLLETAARRYENAHDTAMLSDDREGAAVAAVGRGNVEVDLGRWADAERWYLRAVSLLEGHDGPPSPTLSHAYLDLSIAARRQGSAQAAGRWIDRAAAVARETGDGEEDAVLLNARGLLERARGDLEAAEACLREALDVASGPLETVTITVNLAEVLVERRRMLEAQELGRRAETVALQAGLVQRLPEIYRLLGDVAHERGHEDAFVFYARALAIVQERELPDYERALTLEGWASTELDRGHRTSARARLEEARRLYEALGATPAAERVRTRIEAMDDETIPEGDA